MTYTTDVTNEVEGVRIADNGMMEVAVNEPAQNASGALFYYFDSTMTCVSVRASDSYTGAHNLFLKEGKLTTQLDDAFFDALSKGVRYWDGDTFVESVSQNRHYRDALSAALHP